MAARAGLAMQDLEFVQFHPTGIFPAGQALSLSLITIIIVSFILAAFCSGLFMRSDVPYVPHPLFLWLGRVSSERLSICATLA